MKRTFDRCARFLGMLILGAAMTIGMAGAQSQDAPSGVTFAGGQAIPEGRVEIFLEDIAAPDAQPRGGAHLSLESDGKSHRIDFPMSWRAGLPASSTFRVVAHLEREDGWLLARGSVQLKAGQPVSITLNTVMY